MVLFVALALDVKNDISVLVDQIAIRAKYRSDIHAISSRVDRRLPAMATESALPPRGCCQRCIPSQIRRNVLQRCQNQFRDTSHTQALQNAEVANAIDAGVLPEVDVQNMAPVPLDGTQELSASLARIDRLRIRGEIRCFDYSSVGRMKERYS